MLDINNIRQNKNEIEKALLKRMSRGELDLDVILKLDDKRKELIKKADKLKAEKNKFSKTKPAPEIIKKMKKVGEETKKLDEKLKKAEKDLNEKLSELPNIPAQDVPTGGKENNKILKEWGDKSEFKFKSKDHVELAAKLGLIDYERAVKMSGNGFWLYKGDGALLEWALLNYFVEFHKKNNYEFIIPPYLLTEQSAFVSGHLPKFKDDLFWCEKDKLCLNATAEMMMGNYHRDEILDNNKLPLKYFAFAPSFRREAGAYRKEERGMMRGHQFHKIEMFQFTKPENSWNAFSELVKNAEALVEGLGLHYQTVLLSAGDASAAMAKTIDIEVWIPSMKIYKEVSSISNALDYQARRGNVRYKDKDGKNKFVHSLNASGLATSRLIPAIVEQFQDKDGNVEVPKVLRGLVGKKKLII